VALGFLALLVLIHRSESRSWRFALPAATGLALFAGLALPNTYQPASASAGESLLAAVPFSDAALAEARAANKPVFVWFTADGCVAGKVNEGVAIEGETTKVAFEKAGVVAMRGDWTRRDPA